MKRGKKVEVEPGSGKEGSEKRRWDAKGRKGRGEAEPGKGSEEWKWEVRAGQQSAHTHTHSSREHMSNFSLQRSTFEVAGCPRRGAWHC